ncbi:MAG TPA: PAS domain S-box protein, partial [Holophagaceae bacterium]|nr:PAS domain S-box protein [Holophagaceae bacterium]
SDPAATVGKPILEFIHPSHWPAIQARMARMLAGEPVPPMDYTFLRADGTEVQVEAHVQMLEGGERPVMVSVFTDLTRRLEMEQAIRDSEARFRLISEETGQLTYDFDTASGLVRWAGPMEALLGLPDGLVIDVMEWGARLHPDDYERELAKLQRGLETLEPIFTEYRVRRADGTYLPVEDHGAFLAQPDGKSIRMIGTLRDISGRYAAEQALKESEDLYRSVVEQAQDMIFLVDAATLGIVQANRAFHRALGYGESDLPGLDLSALVVAEPDSIRQNVTRILAEGQASIGRRQYRRAGGGILEVEVSASRMDREGRDVLVVLARDITERLATEQALQQSQRLESLGVLAGGIAHDFNNLLTAMMGNLSLAQLKSHPSSPAWSYLDALEKSLQRATDLTRQMLAYSGKGRFINKVIDLNELVRELTHLLSVSISKRAALRFDPAPGLPPLEADPGQLQQVIMNLVTNASDAIGDADGVIRITTGLAEIDAESAARDFPAQNLQPGPHLLLEVADTGCGMDAGTLSRIFEPFFTTKAKGRGLGLSAMLGILRGHRGGIRIDSAPGRGTTFRIYLPAKVGAQVEEAQPGPGSELRLPGCVLVVDDEPEILRSAVELFQSLGCESVLSAGDGAEALARFRERKGEIALVFMDLTMPRMGGLEAFRAMRAEAPDLPVILTSGYTEEAGLDGEERPSAFLQKPYRYRQLRSAVLEVLRGTAGETDRP